MGRTWASLTSLALVLAIAGRARAGNDEAAAEALFSEAKKLAAKGRYAEACPKFAESNRLDRAAGTLIHLGNCYEKNKQAASAWATYKDAANAAQALGRKDWERLANQRARILEPKLARLTIRVDPANGSDVEVSRDGTTVSRPSFNVAIPVDIGAHSIEASGSGYTTFRTTATVTKDGETIEVVVPKLGRVHEPEAATAPPDLSRAASPSPADSTSGSSQRTVGFVVGGLGVAGVAVGAVTGLMAMGKSNDAKATCANDGPCASREAVDASESAKSFGLVSTVAFITGGAALAAGAALVFTAPSGAEASRAANPGRLRIAPQAGPGRSAGVLVQGVF